MKTGRFKYIFQFSPETRISCLLNAAASRSSLAVVSALSGVRTSAGTSLAHGVLYK